MDFVAIVPVVTALTEVVKRAGIPSKLVPVVAILFGVIFSTWSNTSFSWDVVVYGVLQGLAAVGLYEGVKAPVSTGVNQVKKMI